MLMSQVFERERLNGHYGVTAFVIGNSLSAAPFLLLTSFIPGAIVYFPPGLQDGSQHFFYFALLLYACMLLVESLMMIVASLVPNYLMGIITGAGIQGLMMLGGGFFRLPDDLPPPFWKYPLYYIAFHKYANQGMFKNEFEGMRFDNNQDGDEILRRTWQAEMGYSKWVDLITLFGMAIFYRFLFLVIIKITEKLKPVIVAFLSVPPKQTTQIMAATSATATPLQEQRV
ncbi:ABC transporter G family member 11-like [Melia azedarach]|uniref:ABC transporter G family member 11-like n=1 Tax=Melia azedarach TaxID=155640 RepID=A0ACC1XZF4_MELAZ|nr:ABC transporter G family member 11-like [Melia azedarach]